MLVVKFEEPAEAVGGIMSNVVKSQQELEAGPHADLEIVWGGAGFIYIMFIGTLLKMEERQEGKGPLKSITKSKWIIRT